MASVRARQKRMGRAVRGAEEGVSIAKRLVGERESSQALCPSPIPDALLKLLALALERPPTRRNDLRLRNTCHVCILLKPLAAGTQEL